MKLLEKSVVLNQSGTVKIIPEEPDDFWIAYNLISAGDIVSADTYRKINQSPNSAAKRKPSRVKVDLEIKITAVDYDKDSSVLRVRGKNMVNSEYVKAGAFHTLQLETNKEFNLKKKVWNDEAIKKLEEGCERTSGADLAVVLMHEGLAQFYLVGERLTKLSETIEGCLAHKTGLNKFFESVFRAFRTHVDFNIIRCVVIGSPGSTKEDFRRYLLSEAQRLKVKSIENNKARIVLVNTSSGNKNSLKEVLNDKEVLNLIKDTKTVIELKAFKEFSDMLLRKPECVCYGSRNIEKAQELMAIETLMVTDDLFSSAEIATRKKYIGLVNSVKNAGGKALVFSSTHVSGEQLAQMTGIAAILRFPLPDLDDMEE